MPPDRTNQAADLNRSLLGQSIYSNPASDQGGYLGEKNDVTEYGIKQVGDRYYPVIVDREAGGHYEIKNPMTGGVLSYNNAQAAEKYVERAREKEA